jgi:hypothetical protein
MAEEQSSAFKFADCKEPSEQEKARECGLFYSYPLLCFGQDEERNVRYFFLKAAMALAVNSLSTSSPEMAARFGSSCSQCSVPLHAASFNAAIACGLLLAKVEASWFIAVSNSLAVLTTWE